MSDIPKVDQNPENSPSSPAVPATAELNESEPVSVKFPENKNDTVAKQADAVSSGQSASQDFVAPDSNTISTSNPPVNGDVIKTLDLTADVPAKVEKIPEPAGDYDPRPVEDSARRTIAYLLIGLLWLIVGAILIMIAWQSVEIKDLKEFGVLLSPIVVLVSAATGFYYGTKSSGK